eukprot:4574401-Amphidinium_carterae.1
MLEKMLPQATHIGTSCLEGHVMLPSDADSRCIEYQVYCIPVVVQLAVGHAIQDHHEEAINIDEKASISVEEAGIDGKEAIGILHAHSAYIGIERGRALQAMKKPESRQTATYTSNKHVRVRHDRLIHMHQIVACVGVGWFEPSTCFQGCSLWWSFAEGYQKG